MRYAVRNCFDPRDHSLHASTERETVYVCPGDRFGDETIRRTDDLRELVENA